MARLEYDYPGTGPRPARTLTLDDGRQMAREGEAA